MNTEKNNINLEDKILKSIKEKKITMRPRWEFQAEKIGLESAMLLVVLLLSASISMLFIYSRVNEIQHFVDFGPSGFVYVLRAFPFELFVLVGAFVFLLNLIARKLELNYKVRRLFWYAILLVVLVFLVLISELVGLHKIMNDYQESTELPFLKPYFEERMHNISRLSIEGDVSEVNDEYIKIERQINYLPTTTIIYRRNINLGATPRFNRGDHVRVIGRPAQRKFEAWGAYLHATTSQVK